MSEAENKRKLGKPPWLKVKASYDQRYREVNALLKSHNLHTVCQEANCPNRGECFSSGTATFLIMGPNCTRNCRFCNVTHGRIAPLDVNEPERVAETVRLLKLNHAVITSVTRDDLPDGGASHFAAVIHEIRKAMPDTTVEVLVPDFRGKPESARIVFAARPDVFNHNVETVPRLYKKVRPQADYNRSLNLLRQAADYGKMAVKSGLMAGLGETIEEFEEVFRDLKKSGVSFLTIGQYLAPSENHYQIVKYYSPEEFDQLSVLAQNEGIEHVFSAPLVRSSYHAGEKYRE